jgi:hypothetical protein
MVLVASQPIGKLYGRSLGYTEIDFVSLCLKALSRAMPAIPVTVTLHPEEKPLDLQMIRDMDVEVRRGKGAADVFESGMTMGMSSTIMVLAYLAGRRVVSVQPGLRGPDHCPLSRWGLIPRAGDLTSLIQAMKAPWDKKPQYPLARALEGSLDRLERACMRLLGR